MAIIKNICDAKTKEFKQNQKAMQILVDDLQMRVNEIKQGGGDKPRARHLSRGKLLARERIRQLLDQGAPFLEISQMAAYGMYGDNIASAGIVAGIGQGQRSGSDDNCQ